MKKTFKLISILLVAIVLIMGLSTFCEATDEQVKPGDIEANYQNLQTNELTGTAGRVLGLIRNVAVIAGVVLIAVLGVKYMLGSVEEKAEYKKSFMPLIVGAVVVMAATQIATMLFSLA